ncbi:MAG TPA: cytochrome P450 [Streptosporangiaceae bacterium]|nr:cytochrome P450 [Streptosporangiaceae bacterium]
MTTSAHPAPVTGELDLSQNDFWSLSLADRHSAFVTLRQLDAPPYFADPETPFSTPGAGYYALVKHADVVEASRHPEIFSSARGSTSLVDLPPEFNEYFGSMINMDDPRHARLRRIVSRAFTPKMIKKFEEDVQLTAASIVDDLIQTGPCDFVQQVSARLPLKIICQMMGIGDDHYEMVLRNTNIILGGGDPEFLSGDMDEAIGQLLTAGADLANLVTEMAAARQADPADDLITALATANVDGEQLTTAELASFFVLLVVAGNETTRTAISHALMLLTEHQDQRELLLADFEGRIAGAVEEIVRYVSPVIWMRRSLTRDAELNGYHFREGDRVAMMYWSANRDESVFADPLRFDITRSPNPHVGFGGAGPHFCLGAHLARREITVMLRELMQRVPSIRAVGEPDRLLSSFINGIKHLRCEFD